MVRNTPSRRRAPTRRRAPSARWSQPVTLHSHALDLEPGVFTFDDPARIARSLKRSALRSTQRKAGAFQSAMSMLNFYVNRAGSRLPASRRRTLERARRELRAVFQRRG